MTITLGGTSPAVSFPDGTIQNSANNNFAGPAFSAYQSSTQTGVGATVNTKITFNAEYFDTANCFDSTTNYRFTPTVAGYYLLSVSVSNQTNNITNGMVIKLYKNGSSFQQLAGGIGNTGNYTNLSGSMIVYANGTTDYFEIYCYNSDATSYYLGQFSGVMVRAT